MLTIGNFVTIPFARNSKINLGLDLQGGTDILLQVEIDEYVSNYKNNLARDIKKELFEKKIGYKNFQNTNENLSFTVRDASQTKAVKSSFRKLKIKFKESDGTFVLNISDDFLKEVKAKVLEQSIEIIRQRVDELGNKEISIYGVDDDKISLQIPGKTKEGEIDRLLNTQAKLTFHLMDDKPFVERAESFNPDVVNLEGENAGYFYAVKREVIIDGADLETASATFTETGEAAVSFKFNNRAAAIFGEITMQNIGRPFAIVLDDKVLSAPNIKEPILGGSGIISGSFSTVEANELALLLRAGALPAKINIVSRQEISATLGRESVIMSIKALALGMILVCVFIIARYKWYGVVGIVSLSANILCVLAFLSLFGSTLTLPGIAGIILTVGMAVDGNIIIYENIRHFAEKLSKSEALNKAFENAQTSILDANITTVLSGVMLYEFGFGAIRGFALTLVIGVIFSVFSSLFVTRIILFAKK